MEEQLNAAYTAYTERHGCEPSLLKTEQAYYALIEPFCHTDYDTGADIRYQAALVVVGGFDGWFFE